MFRFKVPIFLILLVFVMSISTTGQVALHDRSEYLQLVDTVVDIDHAYTWYRVCNPENTDYEVDSAAKFKVNFLERKNKLRNSRYEMLAKNVPYYVNLTDYGQCEGTRTKYTECWSDVSKNMTQCEDGTEKYSYSCVNGSHLEVRYRDEWQPYNPVGQKFEKQKCYDVRIYAEYPANGHIEVDNVIDYAGFTFNEYAWWNATWLYRISVNLTEPNVIRRETEGQRITLTGLSFNTNCSDEARLVDIGTDEVINIDVVNETATTCDIAFLANVSQNAVLDLYFYYNATGINMPSYPDTIDVGHGWINNSVNQVKFDEYGAGNSPAGEPDVLYVENTDVCYWNTGCHRRIYDSTGFAGPLNGGTAVTTRVLYNGSVYAHEEHDYTRGAYSVSQRIEMWENTPYVRVTQYSSNNGNIYSISSSPTTSASEIGAFWDTGPGWGDLDGAFGTDTATAYSNSFSVAYCWDDAGDGGIDVYRGMIWNITGAHGSGFMYGCVESWESSGIELSNSTFNNDRVLYYVFGFDASETVIREEMQNYTKQFGNPLVLAVGAIEENNNPPVVSNMTITPATAIYNSSLNCSVKYTDSEGEIGTVYITWNNSGVYNSSFNYTKAVVTDGTTLYTDTLVTPVYKNDVWICVAYANDGIQDGSINVSSSVTVQNTMPYWLQLPTVTADEDGATQLVYNLSQFGLDYDYFDNLTYFVNTTWPPQAECQMHDNETINITPGPGWSGNITCIMAVTDGEAVVNTTLYVEVLPDNDPPSIPVLVIPADGATVTDSPITIHWNRSNDPEGDNLTYYVYGGNATDPTTLLNITTLNFSSFGGLSAGTWYWKVLASDGIENSTSNASSFIFLGGGLTTEEHLWLFWTWKNVTYLNDQITALEGDNKMIGIIFGFGITIAFFVSMAILNKFWVYKFVSIFFGFLEMVFMLGVLYINEASGSLTNLLKINFYVMGLVGLGLVILSLYTRSIDLVTWETDKETKDKWGRTWKG